jgi:hypothetical protein
MKRLIERAQRETASDDPVHVLRLAALFAVKPAPEAAVDDVAAVEAELASFGPRTIPKRLPWWTLGAIFGIALAAATPFVLKRAFAPFDPRQSPVGRALGDGLTEFVGAVAGGRSHALAGVRNEVTVSHGCSTPPNGSPRRHPTRTAKRSATAFSPLPTASSISCSRKSSPFSSTPTCFR